MQKNTPFQAQEAPLWLGFFSKSQGRMVGPDQTCDIIYHNNQNDNDDDNDEDDNDDRYFDEDNDY